MTEVVVRGLSKDFGRIPAVRELSFEIPGGQVTGFLGPNGAGKTTTLRMVLGLVRPTAGTALIDGRRYADLPHPRRAVGAVLEATGVARSRVDEGLDEVELTADADRRVGGYSLGMRQRLGLAAALLGDPRVLVLDEPGNGLDPAGMAWLRGLLRTLAAQGRAVVVSSHVLAEVAQTVDRVVIVHKGRLRFAGALDELADPDAPSTSLESAFLRLTGDTPAVPAGTTDAR